MCEKLKKSTSAPTSAGTAGISPSDEAAVVTARACANIALVKYWGKRDRKLNLPAAGSLSITLDALRTETSIQLADIAADRVVLDGVEVSGRPRDRVCAHLDLVRKTGARRAIVTSRSSFPAAAGLASSASGFAALSVAANAAYETGLDATQLSVLARRGSGSAARSIFGGFVRMDAGTRPDGLDAHAIPLHGVDLELVAAIAVVDAPKKDVSSTEGMDRTTATSPYHESWIAQVDLDIADAQAALRAADMDALPQVVEGSCLAMHADAMAARPGVIYFKAATLWAIDRVRELRSTGVPVMFTIDAGPHLVALTTPDHLDVVATALAEHPDVARVIRSVAGGDACLIDEPELQL